MIRNKIAALFFLLLFALCSGGCSKQEEDTLVGVVYAVSGENEATAVGSLFYETRPDGAHFDAAFPTPGEFFDTMETLVWDGEFTLRAEGGAEVSFSRYSLYCADGSDVYDFSAEFVPPQQAGEYIVGVNAHWQSQDAQAGIRYYFRLLFA